MILDFSKSINNNKVLDTNNSKIAIYYKFILMLIFKVHDSIILFKKN